MPDYNDLFYRVPDGLTLYARDYSGPSADSPVVLLMHGLTRNSRDFQKVAPALAKTHRVVVVEQRGRGKSDYDVNIERYQLPTYMGDMFELLKQLDIRRCATVGTSMGGLMAMGMSALNSDLFTHVVINDIGPVIAQRGLDRIKTYVGSASEFEDWDAAAAHAKVINEVAFPHYTQAQWIDFAQNICAERGGRIVVDCDAGIGEAMRASESAAVPVDLWPLWDSLAHTPTLLVRGEITDLLDLDCVEEMRRRHPSMDYLEVPGVGHAPMLDEAGVIDHIADFINQ